MHDAAQVFPNNPQGARPINVLALGALGARLSACTPRIHPPRQPVLAQVPPHHQRLAPPTVSPSCIPRRGSEGRQDRGGRGSVESSFSTFPQKRVSLSSFPWSLLWCLTSLEEKGVFLFCLVWSPSSFHGVSLLPSNHTDPRLLSTRRTCGPSVSHVRLFRFARAALLSPLAYILL